MPRNKLRTVPRIHFLAPYAYDLRIGGSYNQAIADLPSGAWICLNDHDTLKPPGFAERVQQIVECEILEPDRWLVGGMTNRINRKLPNCVEPLFDEDSLFVHLEAARSLWDLYGSSLQDAPVVPGFCMIFNKALWERLGGWPDKCLVFDSWISKQAVCKVARGLYVLHLYRYHNEKNPERELGHFKRPGSLL